MNIGEEVTVIKTFVRNTKVYSVGEVYRIDHVVSSVPPDYDKITLKRMDILSRSKNRLLRKTIIEYFETKKDRRNHTLDKLIGG